MSAQMTIKELTLSELAREIVLKNSSNDEASAELIRRTLRNKAFLRQMLDAGALQVIITARQSIRRSLEHGHLGGVERGLKSHTAALHGRATLFDWRLPLSGIAIGDATVADISDAVDWHASKADYEAARAEMYRKVQERLARSNKATVRDAMDEAELASLMSLVLADE